MRRLVNFLKKYIKFYGTIFKKELLAGKSKLLNHRKKGEGMWQ